MKKYAFGVDIGGTTIKMGLFHTDGELLDKWEEMGYSFHSLNEL